MSTDLPLVKRVILVHAIVGGNVDSKAGEVCVHVCMCVSGVHVLMYTPGDSVLSP